MGELFKELGKCLLTGLAGFAGAAGVIAATILFWPYSGYVWGALVFVGVCIGLGSDMRSDFRGHGLPPR